MKNYKHIAILGGGPSGLFMFKRLVDLNEPEISIAIFEKSAQLGAGMPYSKAGANDEHITNVSGNEIPELVTSVEEWIQTLPQNILERFNIKPDKFNDYKVMPRLLFGMYLTAQFELLQKQAEEKVIPVKIHLNNEVVDIIDRPEDNKVQVKLAEGQVFEFDNVVVCTGHRWPKKSEGKIPGYFDSPYPPAKLEFKVNHAVAVKGSSLTAIDAIRTLARHNGHFKDSDNNKFTFELAEGSEKFKIIMHSRNGMLPAIRFHLEDPHLLKDSILSEEEVEKNKADNGGFLSLDYVFDRNFKEMFKEKRPEFYEIIQNLSMEDFVTVVMNKREHKAAFDLFKAEYLEAEESIEKEESVYWKEMLAVLSFAMNYPAKYFSAEDMLRLQKTLMPLISIVIAFVPQSSVVEMMALHEAGILEITAVGDDSEEEPQENGGAIYRFTDESGTKQEQYYETFVDCVGQPHLSYRDLPYKSLVDMKTVAQAKIKFRREEKARKALETNDKVEAGNDGNYYLNVPGIAINDNFQVMNSLDAVNERIYMMAVPYIGGYNPDYSGLDFCEAASERIVKSLLPN
ncbi:FAD/NAD(P)-binding protein [Pedobacter sp. Leaf194]|uniref:FAD/NAD(P)-binding protein n=1 Tax=Pedobacter sp. Leaf194 TaxID=1736297 RepID=UPI0009E873ED|nr:FAD/NAD(P)-binding protein [Pedobacter sp. Leaf194]